MTPAVDDGLDQRQEEIIALQAVYGEDFNLVQAPQLDGTIAKESIQSIATVHVELPEQGVTVQVFHTEGSSSIDSATIRDLPPVVVNLQLPPDYPSACPPSVQLYSSWLSEQHVTHATDKLLDIWNEEHPEPICWQWLEWVRCSLIEEVGILETGLHLRAKDVAEAKMKVQDLTQYSVRRARNKFQQGVWQCAICFEDVSGRHCSQLHCGHAFCNSCLGQHCKLHIKEGAITQVKCPEPKCRELILKDTLCELLEPEAMARWEKLYLQYMVDTSPEMSYCPRCSTPCSEDKDHCVMCSKCYYVYCSLCTGPWHPQGKCETLEAKLRSVKGGDAALRMRQELDTLKYIKAMTRRCPRCQFAIHKSEGCNHMHCRNCGQHFCYRCGKIVPSFNPYEHFQTGECILFDELDLLGGQAGGQGGQMEWEGNEGDEAEVDEDTMRLLLKELEVGASRIESCPLCKLPNVKPRLHNVITCASCANRYCYLCGCTIWRKTDGYPHFSESRCVEYSYD